LFNWLAKIKITWTDVEHKMWTCAYRDDLKMDDFNATYLKHKSILLS